MKSFSGCYSCRSKAPESIKPRGFSLSKTGIENLLNPIVPNLSITFVIWLLIYGIYYIHFFCY